ncbi:MULTISPECIES: hypothetical protein [Chryseobacterium]|uniref:Threonyl-tRNA synthetase n=1 Tax=Chryseobacterium camelliae TaxID=1265445 RepID=A0ABU0TGJ9_9FLAO|nr:MULTISPECIES: hypothetical protein [Chryseobacterium]MDT3406260.1 threonyl-tRNA synthetase [Pseudacidovorax intermedius]MDQ1095941.1 threonyl-tRNA synthetase [Chryseobacterium camelliae]MDQ1099877.1 threonyl-tRNA synthetase [Chryseobacterium sp. SORGH_AS_1048]MDR6087223.1 threonyl-tRNA synthetase [Chryseobacterium sp. SORGH_AS_0909]MDR6131597.1 threonyl-tRNA synthetase [Chryseobacterium sp. SORGH_AS_1175]
MKKIIFGSLVLFGLVTVNAQSVTLNVRLKPIQTLVINSAQKVVNLDYTTKDDYANGVSSVNADHLSVYSTGGFQVKVKSANAVLQNGAKSIQASSIQIKATAGSEAVTGAQYAQNVQLSATEATLVTSTVGGVDKKINIEYKGAGANAYLDNYIAGQTPTVYSTELTYTIISQ